MMESRKMESGEADSRFTTYASKRPDGKIVSFLKLLVDQRLIDYYRDPNDTSLITRIKVQKLVYFAQRQFGLGVHYRHTMYLYGPYSTALANDYYRIQNTSDPSSGELDEWKKKEDFLAFAREHKDVDWLEIASTILYAHDTNTMKANELVEHVHMLKVNFEKDDIAQVYDELVQMGFLRA